MMTGKVTRRDFMKTTGLIGVSLLTSGFHVLGQEGTSSSSKCLIGESKLETFANNVRSGGVP
ncbi:MAG: twin-arginine translocation signal domain-containing protein, partial [Candidatus Bipolaricaulota bacterium]